MASTLLPLSPTSKKSFLQVGPLLEAIKAAGLKERFFFTLAAVGLYRLGTLIPVWGINAQALAASMSNQMVGFLDMFSGGALTSLSFLALGIGPYITASIIVQLMSVVIPKLEEMQKEEGDAGRRKLAQLTRYTAVVLAIVQAVLVIRIFTLNPAVLMPGVPLWAFYPSAVISLVTGSMFAFWVSEMITERGIGNGASILIFVGILAGLPYYAQRTMALVAGDPERSFNLVILLVIYLFTMGLIILLQEAFRKVSIVNAKRQVSLQKTSEGYASYIPFKINPAGVMPIIFGFAVLAFPQTLFQLLQNMHLSAQVSQVMRFYTQYLAPGTAGYIVTEFLLIVFFTFFYASIMPNMQPQDIATNLKKSGSSIPSVKPGQPTADYLETVLSRVILIGAIALAVVTLVASSATSLTRISTLAGLGSTALIIMVGVALDTVNQVRVHLLVKQYEGFMKPE